jgi:hypothetical protein
VNQSDAQKVVLASVIVSGAVVLWTNIKATGKAAPKGRSLVAFALLAGALAVGAEVAPAIAGPFAILIALAVCVSRVSGGTMKLPTLKVPGGKI